jgi:ubiquinone/menaquinone biosynthesis C-methylase UbiE
MGKDRYVHGYNDEENLRLYDQAGTLVELLHGDTAYPPGSTVLEAGCGVGAQTVILARKSPEARFLSIDISDDSLAKAGALTKQEGLNNVRFQKADIFALPFPQDCFDHIFLCFVLEHLSRPLAALHHLKRVLKPGGTITVIEGDHGSVYFHPESGEARKTIQCLIDVQARLGGNSLIGRQLYPLLSDADFRDIRVSPRMVYADAGKPELVEGFTKKTFTAMVEGVKDAALAAGLIDTVEWDKGIRGLYRTTAADGTFCYTFFKATAYK